MVSARELLVPVVKVRRRRWVKRVKRIMMRRRVRVKWLLVLVSARELLVPG